MHGFAGQVFVVGVGVTETELLEAGLAVLTGVVVVVVGASVVVELLGPTMCSMAIGTCTVIITMRCMQNMTIVTTILHVNTCVVETTGDPLIG